MHPVQGVGSGIVIRQDGYIMTNSHVVLDAQEVQVTLQYGRTSRAQVRGIDTKTDIAVIHVDNTLPEPQMGARKVKAMNTAVIQFAQLIGFAIAIEPAMRVATQLMGGEIVRRWIGISAVDLNPKMVAYYSSPLNVAC